MLYKAACGYGIAAKLASGWPGRGPFPPEKAPELADQQKAAVEKHAAAAIKALKAAIAAGWDDFQHMREDPDLVVLHERDDFKALLPADR